jgi:hypothetical protein
MNKISNEIAYSIVFNNGWTLPEGKEYEDERMKKLAIRQNYLKRELQKVYKKIAKLHPGKFKLFIDTDDDYEITIYGKEIYSKDYVTFLSLETLEHEIKNCVIEPDDGFLREILNQALEKIKSGEDFSFNGNQTIELERY